MIDTTWDEDLIDSTYGASHSFQEWFNKWFVGAWEPSARGGFEEVFGYSKSNVMTSCKECGALVLHDMTYHDDSVVHLNAHRSWHDKMNDLLER